MRIGDLEQLTNFHDTLNPDLWEGNRLKPKVRLALFKIAKAFVDFINVEDLELTDITISGSNASFNYNDKSDIDLHLIANSSGPCKVNLKDLFQAKKVIFNDQHDIEIMGHAVEVYVQGSEDAHISNGVYSVYNNDWVKFPKKITAKPDVTNIEDKFEHLGEEIKQALDSGDPQTIARLKKRIKDMRQSGLEKNGEFGVENLAFKLLRNAGLIQKLYDAETIETDKELSLSQQGVAEGSEHYDGIEISMEKEDDEIMVKAMMSGGRELGHVLFVIDGEYLAPQDLEVDERYQGQGIAATMYDYVKSKGYKIRRSGQQTDAGAGFWDKHKPGKNVWEQGVAEGNAFLGALNTARKNNLEYFIVDGKKYKVKKNKKIVKEEELSEKWSKKYKRSIDCSHPKGFSQKAHCAGRRKKK